MQLLVGSHFQAQENGLMSLNGVCAISVGLAGHETIITTVYSCVNLTKLL